MSRYTNEEFDYVSERYIDFSESPEYKRHSRINAEKEIEAIPSEIELDSLEYDDRENDR